MLAGCSWKKSFSVRIKIAVSTTTCELQGRKSRRSLQDVHAIASMQGSVWHS